MTMKIKNKLKLTLITLFFCLCCVPAYSEPKDYFFWPITPVCDLQIGKDGIGAKTNRIYSNWEDTSQYLLFNSEKDAYNFFENFRYHCYILVYENKNGSLNYEKTEVLIARVKYIISYYNFTGDEYIVPEDYNFNKQFYEKAIATGENDCLIVDSRVQELLDTIINKGIFSDELLKKYNVPIPENSGRRDCLRINKILE